MMITTKLVLTRNTYMYICLLATDVDSLVAAWLD